MDVSVYFSRIKAFLDHSESPTVILSHVINETFLLAYIKKIVSLLYVHPYVCTSDSYACYAHINNNCIAVISITSRNFVPLHENLIL